MPHFDPNIPYVSHYYGTRFYKVLQEYDELTTFVQLTPPYKKIAVFHDDTSLRPAPVETLEKIFKDASNQVGSLEKQLEWSTNERDGAAQGLKMLRNAESND